MDTIDLCAIPSAPPPNGVSNFVNPPSLGRAVVTVTVVLCVISTTFSIGRLQNNRNKLHWADYFTLIACLTNIAYTGVICSQQKFYRHSWDIPACWYNGNELKLAYTQTMLFAPAFFFPKAAIFLLYQQLFGVFRSARISSNVGIVITLLLYLSEIPLASIYGAPRAGHSWDSLLLDISKTQRPYALGGAIQSGIGMAMDFYTFFLPMLYLANLHTSIKRRVQLVCIFSTAILGVGASVVSLVFKIKIVNGGDLGWLSGISSMATLIETNIAIIVGCMPAFAHFAENTFDGTSLFRSLRTRLHGSRSTRHSDEPKNSEPEASHSEDKQSKQSKQSSLLTWGQTKKPRKNYYELTDSALLKTGGSTVSGDDSTRDIHHDPTSESSSTHRGAYEV